MRVFLEIVAIMFAVGCLLAFRREVSLLGVVAERVAEGGDYRSTEVTRERVASRALLLRLVARVALTLLAAVASVLAVVHYANGYAPIRMANLVPLTAAVACVIGLASITSLWFRALRPAAIAPAIVGFFALPDAWIAIATAPLAVAGVIELLSARVRAAP